MASYTAQDIAEYVGGTVIGDPSVVVTGVNRIEEAKSDELTFLANARYMPYLQKTQASVVLISERFPIPSEPKRTYIVVPDAYHAFAKILHLFAPRQNFPEGFRHPTAVIAESAKVASSAYVGPYVIIGENAHIDEHVVLTAHVVVGNEVEIGVESFLYPNVVCYDRVKIGKRCIVHAGAVIGADGFGYIEHPDKTFEKIPQIGTVVIEDDVEIGANTTIDRATIGATVIERGTKIDNLVHIAHNVRIGEHSALAAQVGIAGSTVIGKRNRLGGQVGVVGHIRTTDDVIIEAQAGVSKSLTHPGAYFGSPAKPHLRALKMEGALRQLPELLQEFRELRRKVTHLLQQLEEKK